MWLCAPSRESGCRAASDEQVIGERQPHRATPIEGSLQIPCKADVGRSSDDIAKATLKRMCGRKNVAAARCYQRINTASAQRNRKGDIPLPAKFDLVSDRLLLVRELHQLNQVFPVANLRKRYAGRCLCNT